MTTVQKNVTQRLFGRTVIDSLDLNQNAWYIDEEQVTATAAMLNAGGMAPGSISVYNATGGAFSEGMPLYITGWNTANGCYEVGKADANSVGAKCTLIASGTTANGAVGTAYNLYTASANTAAYAAVGSPVYLSETAGTFSQNAPTSADAFVQIIGYVTVQNAAGQIQFNVREQPNMIKIGTSELQSKSITATTLGSDVAGTGLTGGNGAAIAIAGKGVTASMLNADIAGNGLSGADGSALALDLNELSAVLVDVSADSLPYLDATGNASVRTTFANLATTMAGEGLTSASGTINLYDEGQTSHGGVFFTNPGDCDAITVGAVTYPRGVVQDVTIGRWVAGATAATSATSLADCINGDTRAPLVYTAEAIGDGVVIRALTPGTAGNVAVAKTGAAPAEPSTLQNLVEGRSGKTCQVGTVYHTVTTLDTKLASFTLELPFSPDTFIVQVRKSTGEIRTDITDQFNFDGSPLGVLVTFAGGTHVVAGDIITVLSISL